MRHTSDLAPLFQAGVIDAPCLDRAPTTSPAPRASSRAAFRARGLLLVLGGWLARIPAQIHPGYRLLRPMRPVAFGPFRLCRHPISVATAAIAVGVVAATGALWTWIAATVVWCALVLSRVVAVEEHGLRRTYGAPYHSHAGTVGRWLPVPAPSAPAHSHRRTTHARAVEASVPLVSLPVLLRSLVLG